MAVPADHIVDDDERRHCGAHSGHNGAQDRHRLHLQNLARRKALEREALANRGDPTLEKLENGFRVCINGANRSPTRKSKPIDAWKKPAPGAAYALVNRPVRVPGAVAVEQPLEQAEHRRRARAATPGAVDAAPGEDHPPRRRKSWVLGQPVNVRTSEGELLELHSGGWGGAAAEAPAPAPRQVWPLCPSD